MNKDKLYTLRSSITSRIKGQEHVIDEICGPLEDAILGINDPERPRASFLFAGPTGVGKTETANAFTQEIFGEDKLFRFDMSEYQHHDHIKLLLGDERGYQGRLHQVLSNHREGTLLFDEMEKAHPLVLDVFLQMLDAARITLGKGELFGLNGFVIVMTTNIGGAEVMDAPDFIALPSLKRTVVDCLEDELRAELLGRFNQIVIFRKLSLEAQKEIVSLEYHKVKTRLAKQGYRVSLTDQELELLTRKAVTSNKGARSVRNVVEGELQGQARLGAKLSVKNA